MRRRYSWITAWVLLLCMCLFPAQLLSVSAAESSVDLAGFPEAVAALTNEFREENGLEPLQMAPVLLEVSAIRAQEQVTLYGHTRPDGSDWFTVVEETDLDTNCYAAENIAAGYTTPEEVVEAWENSQAHRGAMLGEHYQYIGVGVYYVEQDESYYFYYWEMILISSSTPLEGACLPQYTANENDALTNTQQITTTTTEITTTNAAETTETITTAVTTTEEETDATEPDAAELIGDVNGDGIVSLTDAVMLQHDLLESSNDTERICQMDFYADGTLDGKDILVLVQYLVGQVAALPVVPC